MNILVVNEVPVKSIKCFGAALPTAMFWSSMTNCSAVKGTLFNAQHIVSLYRVSFVITPCSILDHPVYLDVLNQNHQRKGRWLK